MPEVQLLSAVLARAGFSHAFFTRRGGVSQPPYDSLNFAYSTGDKSAHVDENVARAGARLGVAESRVYYLHQVHGTEARVLDGTVPRAEVRFWRGDIAVSTTAGVACGVQTADCVPVLIADRVSGAVAAVHSGWRGVVQNAVRAGVVALRELTGADGDLVAAVGPHIERCCFEVGEEVAGELAACEPTLEGVVCHARPKPHVDLRRIVTAQLTAAGVREVDHVRGCSYCDGQRFHSYRRDGKLGGRMLAALVARGERS
ncbi:MAG: peptidoglycan editing factor PgeF [Myxococcales bacterium]|nr:peptidoglycan editing factor PgeF [Myxococcales bacterium]